LALRCSIRVLYVVVRRQSPSYGLTTWVDRKMRRHALTLIVSRPKGLLTGCVCLHALSSFQRTDAKRPERFVSPNVPTGTLGQPHLADPKARLGRPSLGEPFEVTSLTLRCQHIFLTSSEVTNASIEGKTERKLVSVEEMPSKSLAVFPGQKIRWHPANLRCPAAGLSL
jgi:hypothetical protein